MTRLADRLIEEALARSAIVHEEFTSRVAEEPSKAPAPGRQPSAPAETKHPTRTSPAQ